MFRRIVSSDFLCLLLFVAVGAGDSLKVVETGNVLVESNTSKSMVACENWVSYRNSKTGDCVPCSECPKGYLTVVKCEFDQDTKCRPLSDLGEHFVTVVQRQQVDKVVYEPKNSSVEEKTVFTHSTLQEGASAGLIGSVFVAVFVTVAVASVIIGMFLLRRYSRRNHSAESVDPLRRSLLEEEVQEPDSEKVAMDLDALLAARYGKSLVTNNYV